MTTTTRTRFRARQRPIVWIDVETTGVSAQEIFSGAVLTLEVAFCVTDSDLNYLGECEVVIHHQRELLDRPSFHPKARAMHEASGLIDLVTTPDLVGILSYDLKTADGILCDRLDSIIGAPGPETPQPYWGGCSPWLDRTMIERDLPEFASRISYRQIDSSAILTQLALWGGSDRAGPAHKPHRALHDAKAAARLALPIKRILESTRAPKSARAPESASTRSVQEVTV